MKVFVVSKMGNTAVMETSFIPRVGDNVCLFYNPPPVVTKVLLWPNKTVMDTLQLVEDVDAIIMVE